jgi:hypothetical protein
MAKVWFFILVFIPVIAFCDDLYIANSDIVLYKNYDPIFGKIKDFAQGAFLDFEADKIVDGLNGANMIQVEIENQKGWFNADFISILNSDPLPPEITSNVWTHTYYLDVMRSGKRTTLFEYEPFWGEYHDVKYKDTYGPGEMFWNDVVFTSKILLKNIFLEIGDLTFNSIQFLNRKIAIEGNIITVYTKCIYTREEFEESELTKRFKQDADYIIKIKIDGDYLDVFLDDDKLFALFKLTDKFEIQFKELMRNNIVSDEEFFWPRRADGSMDYPLPQPAQVTIPEQSEIVIIDKPPAEYEDAAAVTREIVVQQPGTALPLIIVLIAAGAAIAAGVVVFLIRG